jgi:hypothetical protein
MHRQPPNFIAVKTHDEEFDQAPEQEDEEKIICPVCGAVCVQRRCKVVCESDQCRGRVVQNCSEF